MHSSDIHKWLKKRNCKAKNQYLFQPEQLIEERKIRQIFEVFDLNKSNLLELDEIVRNMNKHGINISMEQMKKIFDIIDLSKDGHLNYEEFKHCNQS